MSFLIEDAWNVDVYINFADQHVVITGIEEDSSKQFTMQFIHCDKIEVNYGKELHKHKNDISDLIHNIAGGIDETTVQYAALREFKIEFEVCMLEISCRKIVLLKE